MHPPGRWGQSPSKTSGRVLTPTGMQYYQGPEKLSGLRQNRAGSAFHREQSINVRPYEPGPDGALVVGPIPAARVALISARIARIAGRERSQAERREQFPCHNIKDALSHNIRQQIWNSCRDDLVGPDGCILMVNYIKKAAGLTIPKSLVTLPDPLGQLCKSSDQEIRLKPHQSFCSISQGRIPEGIYLAAFSRPRGRRQAIQASIHPGERGPGYDKTIFGPPEVHSRPRIATKYL